jgi:superfamily II DNA or RNA helicase
MKTHFNEDFHLVLNPSAIAVPPAEDENSTINPWTVHSQVISPMDSVKPVESRKGRSLKQQAAYNQERFGDLVAAGWDLVIVDEAHRLGGSSDRVARFRLGLGLAESAPYLLLLSATPHQGKTEAFYRLMSLLDVKAFPSANSVTRDRVQPYVIRTPKRRAIDAQGKPLFQPRHTHLIAIAWQPQHRDQKRLYDAVTDYAREGYNQALKQKQSYVGFLMILMQRLVTSSTCAIRVTLEKRLEALREPQEQLSFLPKFAADEFFDLDGQEQVEALLGTKIKALRNERTEVELLLELARNIEANGNDAKAETLLSSIYRLQQEEADPNLKVLIFTEFVSTQEMLAEFLGDRGISVVCLNGSMNLTKRKLAQQQFSENVRVLISTDAGGEGLNLQFCHVIINYDIPWNPMRLEQRIGRVDRIGQKHNVQALNFVFEDTVEYRVREVLEEKLEIILREFGVDKTGDVLDSAQAGELFDELFVETLLNPDRLETKVDQTLAEVRSQIQSLREQSALYEDDQPLNPNMARELLEHPLHHWVELMVVNYLRSQNQGSAHLKKQRWEICFPSGKNYKQVTFDPVIAELDSTATYLSLEEGHVRGIAQQFPAFLRSLPIPCLELADLSIEGTWSLWMLSNQTSNQSDRRLFPLFLGNDGRVLGATARHLWDVLLSADLAIKDYIRGDRATELWTECFNAAEREGQPVYEEMQRARRSKIEQEQKKYAEAFALRQSAITKIGLPQVRDARLRALEREYSDWEQKLSASQSTYPELVALLIISVKKSLQFS